MPSKASIGAKRAFGAAVAISLCSLAALRPGPRGAGDAREMRMDLPAPRADAAPPPPEPLDRIEFCAEKCKHLPRMCTHGLHRDRLSLPAPTCLNYSTTHEGDVYYADLIKNDGRGICAERHARTAGLVAWAAARARERRRPSPSGGGAEGSGVPCEEVHTDNCCPMMYPEEFEFVTKLMANARPETYLEWGTGMSTSFYPLLASGTVIAIDGFPPWCKKVGEEPRVRCMIDEGRLRFHCPELRGADGAKRLTLEGGGKLPAGTPDADVEAAMGAYVESLDRSVVEANVTHFDVALVDGRFRLQCALKLLPYLRDDSVLLMHDFWLRQGAYRAVLDFYYVIGYARSVVALRKKEGLPAEEEGVAYVRYMKRKHLTWHDVLQ